MKQKQLFVVCKLSFLLGGRGRWFIPGLVFQFIFWCGILFVGNQHQETQEITKKQRRQQQKPTKKNKIKEQTLEDMYSLLQTRWIFQLAMLVYEN